MLNCKNNKPYTGCTNDLKGRIERHVKGYAIATKNIRPIQLNCYFAFQNKYIINTSLSNLKNI